MPPDSVDVKNADGVFTLTLNRPDDANTVSLELSRDLLRALERVRDESARAVVLTGAGRFFCAGGDLSEFSAVADIAEHLTQVTDALHAAVVLMSEIDVPVIAAVNGPAAGAGFSLVCACDFVIADRRATFVSAYTKLGFTPDGSLTHFLPRIVGHRRALELILTNRQLSADEALELGIVGEVVDDGDAVARATQLAVELAASAPMAVGGVKRLLRQTVSADLEAQLDAEQAWLTKTAASDDGHEGLAAFLEKRRPEF